MDARERRTAAFHPEGVPFEKLFLVSVASLAPRNTSNRGNMALNVAIKRRKPTLGAGADADAGSPQLRDVRGKKKKKEKKNIKTKSSTGESTVESRAHRMMQSSRHSSRFRAIPTRQGREGWDAGNNHFRSAGHSNARPGSFFRA
jgi:hypothetical protein